MSKDPGESKPKRTYSTKKSVEAMDDAALDAVVAGFDDYEAYLAGEDDDEPEPIPCEVEDAPEDEEFVVNGDPAVEVEKAVGVEEVVAEALPEPVETTDVVEEVAASTGREFLAKEHMTMFGRVLSELPHPSDPNSVRNDGFGYPPGRPRSQWDIRVIRGFRNRRFSAQKMRRFNVR